MRFKNILLVFIFIACLLKARGQQVLQDKIIVLTDRELYLTGETIWLKSFYLDRNNHTPLLFNTIGYVELIKDKQPYAQEKIVIKEGGGNGYLVLPSNLPSGVYQLRMYTNWMKNFGIASFFQKNVSIIHPTERKIPTEIFPVPTSTNLTPSISVQLNVQKQNYKQREKVIVKGKVEPPVKPRTTLVVSVYLVDSNDREPATILSQLNQPAGSFYISNDDIKFLPEIGQHFVNAEIDGENVSKFIGDISFLSILGTTPQLFTSRIDKNGRAQFVINKLNYGKLTVIAQTIKENIHLGNLRILSPFFEEYDGMTVNSTGLQSMGSIQKRLIGQQLNSFNDSTGMGNEQVRMGNDQSEGEADIHSEGRNVGEMERRSKKDTLMFFGVAPFKYLLDDFKRFPSMEEVLREYVMEVLVQKKGKQYSFESISRDKNGFPTIHHPISLLNGVPVSANTVIKTDPLKISRIDILPKRYYYGAAFFDGIISLNTYDGYLGEMELDAGVLPIDYQGMQINRLFTVNNYSFQAAKNSRKPDFRTTLHWIPDLKTDDNGEFNFEFYTSDMTGNYKILVQALDSKGNAAASSVEIAVYK